MLFIGNLATCAGGGELDQNWVPTECAPRRSGTHVDSRGWLLFHFPRGSGLTGQYKLGDGVAVDGANGDAVQARNIHGGPGLDLPVTPACFDDLPVLTRNVGYFAPETSQGIHAAERDTPSGSDFYQIGNVQSAAGGALRWAQVFVVPQYFRYGLERDAIGGDGSML